MKLSFVIPCYGSERTIEGVADELRQVMTSLPEYSYEIIMVSDASPDNVYKVIRELCKADPEHCKGAELARNFGQHAALMAGYRMATGDMILSLDDDGQAPIESVPQMIEALKESDLVFGSYAHKKHNIFRNLGSKVNDRMAEILLGKPKNLHVTSFFAMRRFIKDEILKYDNAFPYLLGLLLRATKNIVNVPVNHRERAEGSSGYTFRKLLRLWINGFTAFSVVPLRIATFCGFLCAFLGMLGGIWCIVNKVLHSNAPLGYSSMMTTILFVGGMLMLMLGMIGEYIGRTYICINKAPQYVIRSTTVEETDHE
jgi:undecaprenyl-phosphate 4-deoxy-4-formamido-L-arabinose transferase